MANQLLAHLPSITKHGYVLVRANDGKFCGIITSADVSGHFETMARPFFLVGDIEARLRKCLAVVGEDAVRAVQKRKTGKIVDLTFGDYKYLIDNEVNWKRIGWTGVPRDQFVHRLEKVRVIRNEIAHFRPEPLTPANLAALEEIAGLLRQLCSMRRSSSPRSVVSGRAGGGDQDDQIACAVALAVGHVVLDQPHEMGDR